jgi:hypothetical protein
MHNETEEFSGKTFAENSCYRFDLLYAESFAIDALIFVMTAGATSLLQMM